MSCEEGECGVIVNAFMSWQRVRLQKEVIVLLVWESIWPGIFEPTLFVIGPVLSQVGADLYGRVHPVVDEKRMRPGYWLGLMLYDNNTNTSDTVYGAVIMARRLREFTQSIWWMQTEREMATNPQTKPTDLAREFAGRLLLSTSTIAIY